MRLKEARQSIGYKQYEVAEYLGVDRTTYSSYETGRRDPDTLMLVKLSELFKVSIDYLLERSDEPSQPDDLKATRQDERPIDPMIKKLLLEEANELSDEDAAKAREYIQFLKLKRDQQP